MSHRRSDSEGREPDFQPFASTSQLTRSTQIALLLVVLTVGAIALLIFFHNQHTAQTQQAQPAPATMPITPAGQGDPNLLLGNPSNATADPSNRDNYLMVKPWFVVSYNSANGTPNWVSWRVTEADLGNAPRKRIFDPDTSLPPGFKIVTPLVKLTIAWLDEHGSFKIEGRMYERLKARREALSVLGGAI